MKRGVLQEMLWAERDETFFAVHKTLSRTPPQPIVLAMRGIRRGWPYFSPVPRVACGNRGEHCASSFDALWVDIDRSTNADPDLLLDMVCKTLGPNRFPTTAVYTGNRGVHVYWKLAEDLPIDEVEASCRALAAVLDGDHCHSRTQLLRNPGSMHPKSGRQVEIIWMSGEIHDASRLTLGLPDLPTRTTAKPSASSRRHSAEPRGRQLWLEEAEALGGWAPLESADLSNLLLWEQEYLIRQPSQGWKHREKTRSEIEQGIVHRLVGWGQSDDQIRDVADQYFAKHREELPRQGYDYIDRTIISARAHHFEKGRITSPLGGWPRQRDAKYRVATLDGLEAELDLVAGQPLAEWVREATSLGRSRSSAYRDAKDLERIGLVRIEQGRITRC